MSAFPYTNSKGVTYYLNTQEVMFGPKGAKKPRQVYYFSKDERPTGCAMPEGMEVIENPHNGFPMVRKIKKD